MGEELWKDIPGYEGMYQVSNMGRVKSLARWKRKTDKLIKPNRNTTGYLVVQCYKDRKRTSFLVHRLVMMVFDPVDDLSLTVNHKDFNIENNCISNLEWCTVVENNHHYWDNTDLSQRKPTPKGESHHLSVLTGDKVNEIRRLYEENIITNKSELARMFSCGEGTIRQVVNYQSWKNV